MRETVTFRRLIILLVFLIVAVSPFVIRIAADSERSITVASTTSIENSGLFAAILPDFTARTGIPVRVLAVGSGQAVAIAARGDADLVLIHDERLERRFIADGYGIARRPIMYNDFVIVGPRSDPARIGGMADAALAFARIADAKAPFVSRSDDSGTHRMELALWRHTGVNAPAASGTWYRETGSGMGATLNTAAAMEAYTLTDRGTWIGFGNRNGMDLLVSGDRRLLNQYTAILVRQDRFPHANTKDGQIFLDWLTSPQGQSAIAGYRIDGRQPFVPNARQSGD